MDDYSSDETLTSLALPHSLPPSLPPVTVTHVDESLPSTSCAHDSIDDHMDSPVADDCFDEPVFTDIDAVVDAASDVVCNTGLDIGTVVVENDDRRTDKMQVRTLLVVCIHVYHIYQTDGR